MMPCLGKKKLVGVLCLERHLLIRAAPTIVTESWAGPGFKANLQPGRLVLKLVTLLPLLQ